MQWRIWWQWVRISALAFGVGLSGAGLIATGLRDLASSNGIIRSLLYGSLQIRELLPLVFAGLFVGAMQSQMLSEHLSNFRWKQWIKLTLIGVLLIWLIKVVAMLLLTLIPFKSLNRLIWVLGSRSVSMPGPGYFVAPAWTGALLGFIVALVQQQGLKQHVHNSEIWSWVNGAAWALGFPVLVAGEIIALSTLSITSFNMPLFRLVTFIAQVITGAVVGGIQGCAIAYLLNRQRSPSS